MRAANGCLEWTRGRFDKGYGAFQYQGKLWRTHRLVWVLEYGPIPSGAEILHHCDNPPCGDLAHLFAGTQLDNMQDMYGKGRQPEKGRYQRTDDHRSRLREVRMAESTAKYGDVPRAGDITELPQRVPPSVPAGTPLSELGCVICGQRFLVPATLAERYSTCSQACSTERRRRRRVSDVTRKRLSDSLVRHRESLR